jgi:hypothetical protein
MDYKTAAEESGSSRLPEVTLFQVDCRGHRWVYPSIRGRSISDAKCIREMPNYRAYAV